MPGHPVLVAHAIQSLQDGVVRHGPLVVSLTRKDVWRQAAKLLKTPQDINCLSGQRYDMRRSHLHALGAEPPFRGLQIELVPRCFDELRCADESKRNQL